MLKKNVSGGIVPLQIFQFFDNFGVKDTSVWGDLSFDKAKELIKTMDASEGTCTTFVCYADSTNLVISSIHPIQQRFVPSNLVQKT